MRAASFLFILLFSFLHLQAQPASNPDLFSIRFTDSVRCTPVKDQANSPTCWVFGTNSLFESEILKEKNKELNLSEMFIARYAYLDKVNAYLASKGKTYCAGGGQFHDVIRVVNRYGMVPEEAYNGRPGGELQHDHALLDSALKNFFSLLLSKGKFCLAGDDLTQINDTLDFYLGKVPSGFYYREKFFTPKTFAEEMVPSYIDYVELMSFANLPYYTKCLLNDKFNWAGDSLYNIPLEDFATLVDTALAKGWSVGWEGDVTNHFFNSISGYAASSQFSNNIEDIRVQNYKNETTERDHMMHITGTGKDETNRKWYYLKNSWGTWLSHFKGFLYMDENYFRMNTVILMLHKEALPASLKEKMGLAP